MAEVKICGITHPADAEFVASCAAWAIGVNFWPRSRRFVAIDDAQAIAAAVAGRVLLVGVFVDATRDEIASTVAAVPLDMIQLHGDESADDCRGWGVPVIKALRLRDERTWQRAGDYPADFILVDAFVAGEPGGTGQAL